jgi:predicted metal-dependent peptidase
MKDKSSIAEEMVANCRTDLCMDLRFITRPVLALETVILDGDGPYHYDGKNLYFHADRVISDFSKDPNIISRVIGHMVMHMVLGHYKRNEDKFRDLAEDMIVEYSLDMIGTPHIALPHADDRIFVFERILKKAGAPTVDLIAEELAKVSEWQINTYPPLFCIDSHDSRDGEEHPEWQEMSAQMMVEIEGFSKNLSGKTDALMRVLRLRNRKQSDYRAFLRKFMTTRERIKVDVNEFDPAYYSYGIQLYGNIPLIDAVEHSNSPMIEDFVIAIDTSGSTMRGPVVRFIEDVYDIMEQCEISGRTNLHIVQCDDNVRSDDVVRSRADMKRLVDNIEVKGGKGTDFRPVFSYVDYLMDEGEFNKLKGLIYFTDGMGIYPTKKPSYPVAFLFCDDRYLDRETPAWAMKVYIGTRELDG